MNYRDMYKGLSDDISALSGWSARLNSNTQENCFHFSNFKISSKVNQLAKVSFAFIVLIFLIFFYSESYS